jgi:hypothetical protein
MFLLLKQNKKISLKEVTQEQFYSYWKGNKSELADPSYSMCFVKISSKLVKIFSKILIISYQFKNK